MLKWLGYGQGPAAEPTEGDPADKIVLLSFAAPAHCCSSVSPFCAKVEMMLRMVNLPYEGVITSSMNPKHAPKSKLPVLQHGKNLVSDSSFITEYLANTYPKEMALLKPADPKRAAIAHAVKCMMEEHYYFVLLRHQWQTDEHYRHYCPTVFAQLPSLLYYILPPLARSKIVGNCIAQGTGRHSFADAMKRGQEDWQAVADIMGDNEYLTGDTPTEADCSVFAFIDYALNIPREDAPLRTQVLEFPNLLAFHKRLKAKLFQEPSKLRALK